MNLAAVWVEPLPLPVLQAGALLLAWAWDQRFGELPNALHPVAWLGRLLGPLGRGVQRLPPRPALLGGALVWCLIAAALLALGWALQQALVSLPGGLAMPLLALLLKPLFAWRMLHDEVAAVEAALQRSLAEGRARLAWLVSRDVTQLDAAQVREAAIETLAENLNDSLVAPLAFFALFGLPGALLYRFANTADAMWGYRGAWEWAGKWAARADDVLSWPTARISAALLRPALSRGAWAELRREAAATPSPNGGWPMGAMALRLGVRLSKPGVYVLHRAGRLPQAHDLSRALQLGQAAATVWWGLSLLGLLGLVMAGPASVQ